MWSNSFSFCFLAGLLNQATAVEFLPIALLACFCSIHNHGFDMIFSFSAIVQHAPYPPIGFSILRAGLIKSVLLSVYTFGSSENHQINTSHGIVLLSYKTIVISSGIK